MKKTALVLMIIAIASRILGFGREIILSYYYGASSISDAFLICRTLPFLIFDFVGIGITTSYIPIVSEILHIKGEGDATKFTNNLISFVILMSSVVVLIVMIFTSQIVKIFASGFDYQTLRLTVILTRISVFSVYSTGLVYIFRGYLQLKDNFIAPELIGLPLNIAIIGFIIVSYHVDVNYLAIGNIIGSLLQIAILIPFLKKIGFRFNVVFDLKDTYLQKMYYLSLPVIIGVSVNQINLLIDRTIASRIATGAISALNYANRLNVFVQSIFVMSIVTVLYPTISKLVAENDFKALKKAISEAISSICILVLPVMVGSMVFSVPIIKLLFGRGAFDSQAIIMTSSALFFYSIGMIGFGLRDVLSRAFYAMQDTKTPMINAALGIVLNIILNIILSRYLGIGGLALATSIAAIFTTLLLFLSLRRRIGPFGLKKTTILFIKILIASLLMGLFSKLSFIYFTMFLNQNISLLIAIGVGVVSYFVIIYFMKINDVDVIVRAIKRKFGRRIV